MSDTQWNEESRTEPDAVTEPTSEAVFEPVQEQPYIAPEEPEPVYEMVPPGARRFRPRPQPLRIVFGDMAGFVFLVWFPVMICFLLGKSGLLEHAEIPGMPFDGLQLAVAAIIAFPPWIILWLHLARGRLWDGILDMFLWAIWECAVMITFSFFFPGLAERIIWNASEYWDEMSTWIATGAGTEGDVVLWLPVHFRHLIMLLVGALIFGFPALIMGVFQLNYMNFYVAQCMLHSANGLLILPIAWHFWSIIRVAGYIVLASTTFQLVFKGLRRAPVTAGAIVGGYIFGLLLVIADGVLKMQYAEHVRIVLKTLLYLK